MCVLDGQEKHEAGRQRRNSGGGEKKWSDGDVVNCFFFFLGHRNGCRPPSSPISHLPRFGRQEGGTVGGVGGRVGKDFVGCFGQKTPPNRFSIARFFFFFFCSGTKSQFHCFCPFRRISDRSEPMFFWTFSLPSDHRR